MMLADEMASGAAPSGIGAELRQGGARVFRIGEVDVKGLEQFANMLGAAGAEAPKAVSRAINRTGDTATTGVVRAVAKQAGLSQKYVRGGVSRLRSSAASLEYQIRGAGGEVPLRQFKARETGAGVSAAPHGKRQIFEGAFMRGGSFPGRVDLGLGGHVWQRTGSRRLPIEKVPSGVFIPVEMVEGESLAAFERAVETVLPRRLDHELTRILG